MADRQQKVIANVVDVCASIIATAEPSDRQYLRQVLGDENRAVFVALALRIGMAKPRIVEAQLEVTHQELRDALDPKKHWIEEKTFVQMISDAVEMKISTHASAVKNYVGGLKELVNGKAHKDLIRRIKK